jgi:hypothetical protein
MEVPRVQGEIMFWVGRFEDSGMKKSVVPEHEVSLKSGLPLHHWSILHSRLPL